MNLDEYKAYVLETRKQSQAEAISVILQSTKKEGSN